MANSERPFWTSLPARILMTVAVIGVLAALMIPTGGKKPDVNPVEPISPPEPVESGCTRDLERILAGMSPGRLGINTGSEDLTVELNRWFAKCGQDIEEELSSDADLQKQLFDADTYESLQEDRYVASDIEHVRMSLLAKQIVENAISNVEAVTEKPAVIFEFVVRHIAVTNDQNSLMAELPATPYWALVRGLGSAEHRAWTFATLLRQINLDAFIVTPQAQPDLWLIGVSLPDGSVQLFEPRLGLPVPALDSGKNPFPTNVATLTVATENPAVLKQLAVANEDYPLAPAALKDINVQIIGHQSLWANRTAKLQYMISPLQGVQLYDGIGKNALRPEGGQRERLITLGKKNELWDESQIKIWEFPLEQRSALITAGQDENSNLRTIDAIFAGPQLLKVDSLSGRVVVDEQTGASVFAAAKTTLHAVRIEQLSGKHDDALPHFGPILTSYKTNPSPLNEEAATFAALWIGISQLGTNRLTAAENSFDRFTSTLRQSRTQLVPIDLLQKNAFEWKAVVEIQQNELDAAIETLKASQANQPSQRNAWLIQRWENLLQE